MTAMEGAAGANGGGLTGCGVQDMHAPGARKVDAGFPGGGLRQEARNVRMARVERPEVRFPRAPFPRAHFSTSVIFIPLWTGAPG